MLMYLLPDDFDAEVKPANFEYYESRTLHKSSLSPAIHAIMGIEVADFTRARQYFNRSAFVDLADNQGNTEEGMHAASAGGTWQTLVCGFGGFRVLHGGMSFNPWLPEQWEEIRFRLFEFVLDGAFAAATGLDGKPASDTYLHAAAKLGTTPDRTIVIEDAPSGVRAGRAGGFWVVGVDRGAGRADLIRSGADVVVEDLAELLA